MAGTSSPPAPAPPGQRDRESRSLERVPNSRGRRWGNLAPMTPVPSRRIGAGGVLAALLLSPVLLSQDPPADGPRQVDPGWHALVNATAITRPGQTVQDATIVLRDGLIVSVTRDPQRKKFPIQSGTK